MDGMLTEDWIEDDWNLKKDWNDKMQTYRTKIKSGES